MRYESLCKSLMSGPSKLSLFLLVLFPSNYFGVESFSVLLSASVRTSSNRFDGSNGGSKRSQVGSSESQGSTHHHSKASANLYDILGASGNETRDELKQLYRQLARQFHPDSVATRRIETAKTNDRGTETASPVMDNPPSYQFSQITEAWSILSDPKLRLKYDRSLRAKQFGEEFASWFSETADQVGKNAMPAIENVALPFLRKTTATALAGFHATVQDISAAANETSQQGGNPAESHRSQRHDLQRTLETAMKAAKRAAAYVDDVEMLEKCDRLEREAAANSKKSQQLLDSITDLSRQIMYSSLHHPGSGLMSSDAFILLQELKNQTAGLSGSGRNIFRFISLRRTLHAEINRLVEAEQVATQMTQLDSKYQTTFNLAAKKYQEEQTELREAKLAEEEALKALERARKRVAEAKASIDETKTVVQRAAVDAKKSESKLSKSTRLLTRRSERVRKSLLIELSRVQKRLRERKKDSGVASSGDDSFVPLSDLTESSVHSLQEIESLRCDLEGLKQEKKVMDEKASRLLSRVRGLKTGLAP